MAQAGDPVGSGLVASLARPGGNVTGLSNLPFELNTKRLEILKEAVPKLARVLSLFFTICRSVPVQQAGKVFRIGFLERSTASGTGGLLTAFRQELSKLGWVEGKDVTFEFRFADQIRERLPELRYS